MYLLAAVDICWDIILVIIHACTAAAMLVLLVQPPKESKRWAVEKIGSSKWASGWWTTRY